MPRNLTLALETIKHINMLPVYGLNVYSMLKYQTLVITESAIEQLQEKLLTHLNAQITYNKLKKFKVDSV